MYRGIPPHDVLEVDLHLPQHGGVLAKPRVNRLGVAPAGGPQRRQHQGFQLIRGDLLRLVFPYGLARQNRVDDGVA